MIGLPDGGFAVAYDSDGTGGLLGQRYDSAGASVGTTLVVDAGLNGQQPRPQPDLLHRRHRP